MLDPLAEQLVDAAAITPGMRVVDVLAWWGMLTSRLRAAAGADAEVVAVEDGDEAVRLLHDELRSARVAAEVVTASPLALPFDDGHFDVALSLLRIGAWEGGVDALREMERVSTRSVVAVARGSPAEPEDVLAQAWRDVTGNVPDQLQVAPPLERPSGWTARRISDVARFDGEAQLWTVLIDELDLTVAEPVAASLRARWRELLVRFEGADGTLRVPVHMTLLCR